jgi:beta-lactamase regulating signal transducer with metallopeptidase domain
MISTSLDLHFLDLIWWLLESAIRSLGLAGLVGFVLIICRVKRTAIQLSVWTCVLFAALAMPFLSRLLPTVPLSMEIVNERQSDLSNPVPKNDHLVERLLTWRADNTTGLVARRDPGQVPGQMSISWPTIAISIYLLITGFLLAKLSLGYLLSRKLRRTSQTITDRRVQEILTTRAKPSPLIYVPVLGESKDVIVPVTLGIIHPCILLPDGWRNWEDSKLRAVLIHELSHATGRHYLRQFLASLHRAFFWFSPFSWWLKKHLAELAEQIGDESALLAVSDRNYYAEVLLGFFSLLQNRGRVRLHGISIARPTRAARRLDKILSAQAELRPHLGKAAVILLFFSVMPLVYLMAAVKPSFNQKPDSLNTQTSEVTLKADTLNITTQDTQASKVEKGKRIWEMWIDARGGRHRLSEIKEIQSSLIQVFPGGLKTDVTRYKKGFDKFREEMTGSSKRTTTTIVNGDTVWRSDPITGELKDVSKYQKMPPYAQEHEVLLNPEKFGFAITLEGRESIIGKEYIVLNQAAGNQITTHYIDPDTFLRYKYRWTSSGSVFETREFEYRDIEGTKVPFSSETTKDGEFAWKIIVYEYKYNPNLEDSLFEGKLD